MARANVNEEILDDEDLDLTGVEEIDDVVEEGVEIIEDEVDTLDVDAAPAPKAKKEKKEKVAKEPKEKVVKEKDPNSLSANEVANMLGVSGLTFRTYLRTKFKDAHKKGTGWNFVKGSPELQEIIDEFNAKKSAPKVKKEKADKTENADVVSEEDIDVIE